LDVWTNTSTTPLDVVYSFIPLSSDNCSGASFSVTVTVNPEPEVQNQSAIICSESSVDLLLGDDIDGPSVVSYDLTTITPSSGLVGASGNAVVATNLTSDAIALDVWTNTSTTPLDVVYSFIPYDIADCIGASFTVTLTIYPLPVPEPVVLSSQCDDDTDGLQTFDMSGVASQVIGSQTGMDVSYHATQSDAEANANALGNSITTTQPDAQTIYIRLENTFTGCYVVSTTELVVDPLPIIPALAPLVLCDDTNSGDLQEEFDLSERDTEVINGQQATVSYHATEQDAQDNILALPTLYTSVTQTIYAALQYTATGCRSVAELELIVDPLPSTISMTSLEVCDDDSDGITVFTLTDKDIEALDGQTGVTVSYYLSEEDANNAVSALSSPYTNTTLDLQTIFIRLTTDATGCYSTMSMDLVVHPLPVPEPVVLPSQCDDNTDGLQTFDMSGVASQVIGFQTGMDVSYHATQSDAEANTNALGNSITTTQPDAQTIYIRLENILTGCYVVSTIELVVDSLPVVNLDDNYVICSDALGGGLDFVEIDPGLSSSIYSFIWRDELGTVLSTSSTYTVDQGGIYSLEVSYSSSSTGCSAPLEIFTVSESGSPDVSVDVVTEDFSDTHIVVATAIGTGTYEFSLDQGPWQDSGTFIGVLPGDHAINVRDINGCGVTVLPIFVVDYPRYFTPNGDGYHDTWNIPVLSNQLGSRILIFDRFGKLLKQISPAGVGWDGTFNGQQMPTTDYWFLLNYNDLTTGEPKQLRAHFSLKR
jgi:gliding motility-associated-like protein